MLRFFVVIILLAQFTPLVASNDAEPELKRVCVPLKESNILDDEEKQCFDYLHGTSLTKEQTSSVFKFLLYKYHTIAELKLRAEKVEALTDLVLKQKTLQENQKAEMIIFMGDYLLKIAGENPDLCVHSHSCFYKIYNMLNGTDDRWYAAIIYALQAEKINPNLAVNSSFDWPEISSKLYWLWADVKNVNRKIASFAFAAVAMEAYPLNWTNAEYVFRWNYENTEPTDKLWIASARRLATLYSIGGFGIQKDSKRAISVLERMRNYLIDDADRYFALSAEIASLASESD